MIKDEVQAFVVEIDRYGFFRADTDTEYYRYLFAIKGKILTNSETAPSPSILWEALKAYLRGQIISFTSLRKKEHWKELELLEAEIRNLEKEHFKTRSEGLYRALIRKRNQYNVINTYKTEKALLRTRQRYYELGDKGNKLLAWQLKKQISSSLIQKIKKPDNTITCNPKEINNGFQKFYENLYSSECVNTVDKCEKFLSSLSLPKLSLLDQTILEQPLTSNEILQALMTLQSGKAPALDGFTPEFYKKFQSQLMKPLMDMYRHSINNKTLPPTAQEALIALICKPEKDPEIMASYRPISLLSVESKIFAKAIAIRLEKHLSLLIHKDQTGFIRNRSSMNNLRRLFYITSEIRSPKDTPVIASLDAEKAFDRVEWCYMYKVLEHFNFGNYFMNCVKLLYDKPRARVSTNGIISNSFAVGRGTRQGCPLSPLIFALILEPLAQRIREDPNIMGIPIGKSTHKIALYADDILLFLSNPDISLKTLLSLIDDFSSFSGYKINWSKSELLPLSTPDSFTATLCSPFQVQSKIKYLGIITDGTIKNLYKLNYLPLLQKIEKDLVRWTTLPLSLIGRTNVIKMNIFPRLMYLFQSIPIDLPQSFFKKYNKLAARFIWSNKAQRIKRSTLCLPIERGGLGLPDIQLYFWAAQLRPLFYWFRDDEAPSWTQIESDLSHIPYCFNIKTITKCTNNPIITHSLRIWDKINHFLGLGTSLSPLTPIGSNPSLDFVQKDLGFKIWGQKNINKIGDLYDGNTLKSFQQLRDSCQLPATHFYRYLQLRHFIRSQLGGALEKPEISQLESLLTQGTNKKQISKTYNLLIKNNKANINLIKEKWEKDLEIQIEDDHWSSLLTDAHKRFINTRYRICNFKTIHRVYYTPEKISRFKGSTSSFCKRCKTEIGNLLHMFWTCPQLEQWWKDIEHTLKKVLKMELSLSPLIVLLGDYSTLRFKNATKLNEPSIGICGESEHFSIENCGRNLERIEHLLSPDTNIELRSSLAELRMLITANVQADEDRSFSVRCISSGESVYHGIHIISYTLHACRFFSKLLQILFLFKE
uniref:Reverse transcriptase domain-containing protein n=1 Tax=Seriola lalandi dorsalis TaxID=1841481 RepID=A0A3B4X6N3_SERLL